MPVQSLPAWFPLSPAACCMPIAGVRRCRTWPPHRLEQVREDNTLVSCSLHVRSMHSWPLSPYPVASLPSIAVHARPALPCPAVASTTLRLSRPFLAGHDYKMVPLHDHLSMSPPPSHPFNHRRPPLLHGSAACVDGLPRCVPSHLSWFHSTSLVQRSLCHRALGTSPAGVCPRRHCSAAKSSHRGASPTTALTPFTRTPPSACEVCLIRCRATLVLRRTPLIARHDRRALRCSP
jgi:hypothetical protein